MATSWVEVSAGHGFPIQNIPFGVYKPKEEKSDDKSVCASRIGDFVSMDCSRILAPVPRGRIMLKFPLISVSNNCPKEC